MEEDVGWTTLGMSRFGMVAKDGPRAGLVRTRFQVISNFGEVFKRLAKLSPQNNPNSKLWAAIYSGMMYR